MLIVLGTKAYTPPEYFSTGKYDGCQGTVWQLGILLVEMLSPVMAFDKPEQALTAAPRIPENLSPGQYEMENTSFSLSSDWLSRELITEWLLVTQQSRSQRL